MTRQICDKCGKILPEYTAFLNAKFPIIKITKQAMLMGEPDDIDLCENCKNLFLDWISSGVG